MKASRRDFLAAVGSVGIVSAASADAAVDWDGKLRLIQGPMLGFVSTAGALVWGRTSGEHEVKLQVIDESGVAAFGPPVRSSAKDDFCVSLQSPVLKPGTRYRYRVFIDDREDEYLKDQAPCYLRSAPAGSSLFSVAFGSCAKFQDDPVQDIWNGVEAIDPDLFFWLGDNVYIDSVHREVMQDCYQKQRGVLSAKNVLRNIPQLATWDDHDFCLNDHDRRNPAKETALKVFKQYWANPAYGQADNPGTYFYFQYGGVDFFFIDVRYNRDPNTAQDNSNKTMLGKAQLEWLKQGLAASDAPFKVLVSGSGWNASDGPTGDTWSSRLSERNTLFEFIVKQGVSGVVLLSGDTHVGEFNCIPWADKGGYDFYELVSSPLAQKPQKGDWIARHPEIRLRQVYARSNNVGLLEFDLKAPDPTVTMTLRDTSGQTVWWQPLTLKASELTNGRSSWRNHIDKLSLKRHESLHSNGVYYIPKEE